MPHMPCDYLTGIFCYLLVSFVIWCHLCVTKCISFLENEKIQGEALTIEDQVISTVLVNSGCVFRQLTLVTYVSKFCP